MCELFFLSYCQSDPNQIVGVSMVVYALLKKKKSKFSKWIFPHIEHHQRNLLQPHCNIYVGGARSGICHLAKLALKKEKKN